MSEGHRKDRETPRSISAREGDFTFASCLDTTSCLPRCSGRDIGNTRHRYTWAAPQSLQSARAVGAHDDSSPSRQSVRRTVRLWASQDPLQPSRAASRRLRDATAINVSEDHDSAESPREASIRRTTFIIVCALLHRISQLM